MSVSIPEKADRPYSERVLRNLAAGITQDQANRLLLAGVPANGRNWKFRNGGRKGIH